MKIMTSSNENSGYDGNASSECTVQKRSMGVRVILVVELKERAYKSVCSKGDASSNITTLVGEKTQHLSLS